MIEHSAGPIFIVGANRSGTTLLRLMLNAHSRIAIPDEMHYFRYEIAGIPIENWQRPTDSRDEWWSFIDRFIRENCGHLDKFDVNEVARTLKSVEQPNLRDPLLVTMNSWAHAHGKSRWGEKTPGTLYYCDVAHAMFPNAKFIYMARDPRGGLLSMQNTSFYTNQAVINCLIREKSHRVGRATLLNSVPAKQRIDIRYEDLVAKPEETLQQICEFLDEPFEQSMLEFYRDSKKFMIKEASSDFNKAAHKPIDSSKANRWLEVLTKDEIATAEAICRDEIQEFNYLVTNAKPSLRQSMVIAIQRAYWNHYVARHQEIREFTVMWNLPFNRKLQPN